MSPPPQVRVSRGVSLPVSHSVSHYTNSVKTAQPHWATTGSQKGALGASRAAWRVAIDATLVSFEALCAAGTNTTVLGSRRCELSVWMWDFRSSSHLIPRFGDRPDRSPTRSPRHRITRLPIGASATDAVHQDDVDGQYPQSLMTSRWCPSSNMSHWPRLGRGQAPCSCSATATLKNDAIPVAIPD